MKTILQTELLNLNIYLSDQQTEQFLMYYDLLVEWNKVMNLTGITEYEEVVKKHFIDSLSFIKVLENNNCFEEKLSLIDIGTGAGFPGIPLKIVFPNLNITLLDSLNKRINFLNEVISKLDLYNIKAIHGRAEDYAKISDYREQYDFAVSRAVSNLSTLSEYCLPFVKINGLFISYKSERSEEELIAAQNAISTLGGKFIRKIDFNLYENYRSLIVIQKHNITPLKFPRKSGMAQKKPL